MTDKIRLFLCGDVMTGRGVDQIFSHSSDPRLYERYVRDAREYVRLAERAQGKIERPVEDTYIWGDALEAFKRFQPAGKIINLETAVARSDVPWPGKGIHYRMHPENLSCLTEVGVDVCSLANNHVLDWGVKGLEESLHSLSTAGIGVTGAGTTKAEAQRPALLELEGGYRMSIFGLSFPSSGVPRDWRAAEDQAGVHILPELSEGSVAECVSLIRDHAADDSVVLVSLHWGKNWGYRIPGRQRRLAHRLIAEAGVDLIHGHSSHHVKGIEIHRGRLILYGCGDFINDYEGIQGRERFRGDLTLMYFPELDPETGHVVGLEMVPLQRRKMQLHHAGEEDARWLLDTLKREGGKLHTEFEFSTGMDIAWIPPL